MAAQTIREGRANLLDDGNAAAVVALSVLKKEYASLTAWFEHGYKGSDPLHRPYWRRAIIERSWCNMVRAMAACEEKPFATGLVDTALWAVDNPDVFPDGLKVGNRQDSGNVRAR